ncbi:MAG: nitrate reductase molybdenum cofactor assembly chaperone [Planctomycetota bacterium]
MQVSAEVWEAFADLLSYPAGNVERLQSESAPRVIARFPALSPEIAPLVALARERGEGECEELYTRTFDGSAERALELGWHLHGENYARGVLLVRLRAMLRTAQLDEQGELPDHVSNVLRLLGRVDGLTARALIEHVLAPGLDKLVERFTDADNPYRPALVALRRALAEANPRETAS